MNREIEWLEIQQFDILQEGELNRIAVTWQQMDRVEQRRSINYVLRRLVSIKNSSAYVKDIYVHIPSINKTISANSAVHALERERYEQIRSMGGPGASRLVRQGDSLQLSAFRFGGKHNKEPLCTVQVEIDSEKLKDTLQLLNVYPGSGSMLISKDSGFQVESRGASQEVIEAFKRKAGGRTDNTIILGIEGHKYHFNMADSNKLNLSLLSYLPEETVKRPLYKFNRWAWLFMITSVFALLVYIISTYRFVHRPLLLLVQSFRRMESGILNSQIKHAQKDEFGYLYDRFNQMLIKLQTLIDQDYKQKLMMQKAELKQLQSQINPHFLYNSFFILNSLAKTGDIERIEKFTVMLGEYYRFITRNSEDNVPLSEEIKHARRYMEIQQLRFSRRIRVQFDELPKEMERIKVPRLIVQPIIENAYEHSLEKVQKEGLLRVTFAQSSGEWTISVEDNGICLDDAEIEMLKEHLAHHTKSHEMTGLMNIHRRIVLTYGEGSGLIISRSELNGLKIVIRIQAKEEILDV
ncbi:sensor histidine kinase [Paenibacillus sp. CAA11]|uniref:sensor histidine kinase n=1 Tax=Paenibacillus sp. CAA11 TaxID=1532905 RepID=UPI003FA34C94